MIFFNAQLLSSSPQTRDLSWVKLSNTLEQVADWLRSDQSPLVLKVGAVGLAILATIAGVTFSRRPILVSSIVLSLATILTFCVWARLMARTGDESPVDSAETLATAQCGDVLSDSQDAALVILWHKLEQLIFFEDMNLPTTASGIRSWLKDRNNEQAIKNVGELDLRGSGLSELPPEIGLLTGLAKLCLSENQLKSLPLEIGRLKNLQHLDLSNNRLESLPTEIGELFLLTHLNLSSNKLREIPSSMANLGKSAKSSVFESLDIFVSNNPPGMLVPSEIFENAKLSEFSRQELKSASERPHPFGRRLTRADF